MIAVKNPRIKGWLAENGYTITELSEMTGIPYGTIRYRMDERTEWKLSEIKTLIKVTGKTFDELF